MDVDSVSAERSFLEFVYGQPREPDWIMGILYGIEGKEEPDIQEMKQMLVHLRLQLRVLFEKQRNLTNKLENSAEKVKKREEQLLVKEQMNIRLRQQIAILKRKINIERVRFGLTLKETENAAEKEKMELKNAMNKAEEEFHNRRRTMMKACFDSRREAIQTRQHLEESIKEISAVTDSFKAFYVDYLRLERDLKDIEEEVIPLQSQIYDLAKALNVEPMELLTKLEQLKITLTSDENMKELLIKNLLEVKNDEVSPKDSETVSISGENSATESFNNPRSTGSSSNLKRSDLSCPFSQKLLPEQLDNPRHKDTGKKPVVEKGKVVRPKLSFKIPKWPLRQAKNIAVSSLSR